MTIGENIRKYRKMQGLTQKELANLAGLNEVTIRSYELGKYKPKLETLRKISKALGVYIGSFIEDWSQFTQDEIGEDFLSYANSYDDFLKRIERQQKHEEKLLLTAYRKLNSDGQQEARKRIKELTEIKRYTKQPAE